MHTYIYARILHTCCVNDLDYFLYIIAMYVEDPICVDSRHINISLPTLICQLCRMSDLAECERVNTACVRSCESCQTVHNALQSTCMLSHRRRTSCATRWRPLLCPMLPHACLTLRPVLVLAVGVADALAEARRSSAW